MYLRKTVTSAALIILLLIGNHLRAQEKFPYQNPNLSTDERVNDLITRMTLQEKLLQLFSGAPAIDRLGVPAYDWWNECLHGVARAGKATVFPQAIGLAATFDEPLMFHVADAISDEARAKHHFFLRNNVHSIYTGLTFWSPNINIFRDPRWGRGQETYGEDPFLTSRMAVNFIKGLQGNDPKYFKTIATAKHYAVHSGPEFTRHNDNVYVNDRDLYETYLPAFKAAVKEANVQSVMCAYNRFRDKPCCGSDLLLSDILRNSFGFKGYVVSDCGAISDFYQKEYHHVVESPSRAWGWSIASGTDLNCEVAKSFVEDNIEEAVKTGVLNEKDINTSLSRLYKARFMLGMFDPPESVPYSRIPMSVVGSREHLELSQQAAEKSLVLLKNNGILPLRKGMKVALIGPNANSTTVQLGNYNGDPIDLVTPLRALRERIGNKNVRYSPGCAIVPGVYTDYRMVPASMLFHMSNGKLEQGLKAEYFEDITFQKDPFLVRTDSAINFYWERSPIHQLVDESFAVRWSGTLIIPKSGSYLFSGNVKVKIDGKEIDGKEVNLERDKSYQIVAELVVAPFWWSNNHQQQFANLSWLETSRDYKKEALDAARNSDVVIFCGGISSNLEGEEMKLETDGFAHGDRTHIELPAVQDALLKSLYETGKPIVYVNFSGSAVALNWENEKLPAVIQAFYPGERTGTALVRMLYGEYNPSGRLPVTFYKSINDIPAFKDYRMEGKTYRYFKGEPLFEFGFGLSYSKYEYKDLHLPKTIQAGEPINFSVMVSNTGKMDGEEVVEVYVSLKEVGAPVPLRSLVGFKRVMIKSGATENVSFTILPEQTTFINNAFDRVAGPGKIVLSVGGKQPDPKSSGNKNWIQSEVIVTGKESRLN